VQKTVGEIAQILGGTVIGNKGEIIQGLNSFELAQKGDITFAEAKRYLEKLETTQASCVLIGDGFSGKTPKTLIQVKNPKEAFVMLLHAVHKPPQKKPGVHPTAVIGEGVQLGKNIFIGPYVVIEDRVTIGDGTQIGANSYIGTGTVIGSQTVIYPNVSIYHEIKIGSRVIINSGCVIGADGFGFYEKDNVHHKIPQTGNVIIEDDVELGSNDTIDRATFGSTVIGRGTKLDDMVHVAHNCQLGKNVIMCGQAGIAGSTVVEDNVMIGAQAGVKDHIRLKKRSLIGATAAVKEDTQEGEYVLGMPAINALEFGKRIAALGKLTSKIATLMRMTKDYEAKNKGEGK
jgi:UDP-3-O-[3-hydroxymyristoyl] glucosamine N-acyltransferase